ncbi:MAG TPA: carboxyl transferase domain-containing protein [Dermatophilaceae bacterium]|nr:carboxyl transferase domain-containing protein [Dermatophilaceae bacterium]
MTGTTARLGARDLIVTVLDDGSWESWDEPAAPLAQDDPRYAAELAAAAAVAGTDESVLTGSGRIRGIPVALIVGEFAFLAGSIGRSAAERVVRAFERAGAERLPLLAAPVSGGTRMQEGTPAFVGMVKISAACATFKQSGLPYLVYLRNPTTGGVFASWGSLGHATAAEPGAMIGFLGPRVYEALYGQPFPEGVQTAENLYANGLLDAVLPVERLAEMAERFLRIVGTRHTPRAVRPVAGETGDAPVEAGDEGAAADQRAAGDEGAAADQRAAADQAARDGARLATTPAWVSVTATRREDRPGVRALLRLGATDVVPLHGTGAGEVDRSLILAAARFAGASCLVLGQDRRSERLEAPLSPSGLRVARRGMRIAQDLRLPLVTVIDTAGAALSREAEEGGMAGEIARCLSELVMLDAVTLCVLLGQGTGGGALALLPADRVVCAEHSWLSPLPPEGAAAILHRDVDRAPDIAAAQRVRSGDLLADGIVDRVVPERPDAAEEPEAFCLRMAAAIDEELATLLDLDPRTRLDRRLARFRTLGLPEQAGGAQAREGRA